MQFIKRLFESARQHVLQVLYIMVPLIITPVVNYVGLWYNDASFGSLIFAYLFVVSGKICICGHKVYTSQISRYQIMMFSLVCICGFDAYILPVTLLPYFYALFYHGDKIQKHIDVLMAITVVQLISSQFILQILTVIYSLFISKNDVYLIVLIFANSFAIASIQNNIIVAILTIKSFMLMSLFVLNPKIFKTNVAIYIKSWMIYVVTILVFALMILKWFEICFLICHLVCITTALLFYIQVHVNLLSFYVTWCKKMNIIASGSVIIHDNFYQITLTPLTTAFCVANLCIFRAVETNIDMYTDLIKQYGITDNTQISTLIASFSESIIVQPSKSSIKIICCFINRYELIDELVHLFYKKILVTNTAVFFDMSTNSITINDTSIQTLDIYMMTRRLLWTNMMTGDIGLVILKFMMRTSLKQFERPSLENK